MSRYLGKMNLYFVYISDGEASHPAAEIQEMLRIKTTCTENGETFRYASILIGEGEGKRSMELINQELKGTSEFVNNPGQISAKFKEILNVAVEQPQKQSKSKKKPQKAQVIDC